MANDGEVKVGIKLTAEGDGAAKASSELDRLNAKSNELGRRSVEASQKTKKSFRSMETAAKAFRSVLGVIGAMSFGAAIIAGARKIAESFRHAEKQAGEFAKIESELAEKSALRQMASDASSLADAVSRAAAAEQRQLSLIDEQVSARRRLQKAQLEAAKADELSKLDSGAGDYDEQVKAVEAKYERLSTMDAASNAKEDVVLQRQKIESEIGVNQKSVEAEAANEAVIRRKIANAERMKGAAEIGAVSINESDKTGTVDALGKTFGQILTGQWGRAAGATTEEGDAIRRKEKEKAAELSLQLIDLNEELRKSLEKQKSLRQAGADLRKRMDGTDALLEAAEIEGETMNRNAERGQTASNKSLSDKRESLAAEEDEREKALKAVGDGRARLQDLSARKQALEAQKAESEERIAQARLNAEYGQYGSGDAAGLAQTAKMVERRERGALKAIEQALANIEEDMKDVERAVRKNESRAKIRSDEG